MEHIAKPHCGARLDRLPDCRWHSSMFAIVAFGLLVCWSNAVGGLILAQLKELGWTDNSTTATFSAITTAGMFLGALGGGIIGDKIGRKNAFILYEAIHIIAMVVGAFSPNGDPVCRVHRIYAWQKSRHLVKPGLVYRQLVLSALFAHRHGIDAVN